MLAKVDRSQLSAAIPAIGHLTALVLVLLVLLSPTPLPFGPSLIKIDAQALNVTSGGGAPGQTETGGNSSLVGGGINITLSNSSVVQVKPRAVATEASVSARRMRKVMIRDAPVDTPAPPPTSSNNTAEALAGPPPPTGADTTSSPPTTTSPSNAATPSATSLPSNVSQPASPPVTSSSPGSSLIKMTFGPLGSCFYSAQGVRDCTAPHLNAKYDLSALTQGTNGTISTVGLPSSLGGTPRSVIILVAVIVLAGSSALALIPLLAAAYPDQLGKVLEPGHAEQALRTARKLSVWALGAIGVLLMGATVSLRFSLSGAVSAFNAANARAALPPSLLLNDTASGIDLSSTANGGVGLHAQTGTAFGMLWIACAVISVLVWTERRRARTADAVAAARVQIDAEELRKKRSAEAKEAEAKAAAAKAAASHGDDEDDEERSDEHEKRAYPYGYSMRTTPRAGRAWEHHSKRDSLSSSVDFSRGRGVARACSPAASQGTSPSSLKSGVRRKRVVYPPHPDLYPDSTGHGSGGERVARPARTCHPHTHEGRACEEVERADSPAMRHQWVPLQAPPGHGHGHGYGHSHGHGRERHKHELPMYEDTYAPGGANVWSAPSSKPCDPRFF